MGKRRGEPLRNRSLSGENRVGRPTNLVDPRPNSIRIRIPRHWAGRLAAAAETEGAAGSGAVSVDVPRRSTLGFWVRRFWRMARNAMQPVPHPPRNSVPMPPRTRVGCRAPPAYCPRTSQAGNPSSSRGKTRSAADSYDGESGHWFRSTIVEIRRHSLGCRLS